MSWLWLTAWLVSGGCRTTGPSQNIIQALRRLCRHAINLALFWEALPKIDPPTRHLPHTVSDRYLEPVWDLPSKETPNLSGTHTFHQCSLCFWLPFTNYTFSLSMFLGKHTAWNFFLGKPRQCWGSARTYLLLQESKRGLKDTLVTSTKVEAFYKDRKGKVLFSPLHTL